MSMPCRRLGRTGLTLPVIGVGTWQFGGEWGRMFTQAEVDAILDRAAERGMRFIDTAECYGDHLSERLIGDYLHRRNRSDWIIATKFGHRFHGFMNRTWALDPDPVRAQLDDSLRALGVDCIDLYQFHSGSDEAFENPALWEMLHQEKNRGRIRALGISIRSAGSRVQAERASSVGAGALQVVYNRLARRPETDAFPAARAQGLGVLARVPLASGMLAGVYRPGHRFEGEDVRATFDPSDVQGKLAEAERVRREEIPEGVDPAAWALAWCLRDPTVTAVIPGCKSPVQVDANARAVGLML